MTFAPSAGNIVGSGWFEIKPGLSQDTADLAKGFAPLGQSAASAFAQSFSAGLQQNLGTALAAAMNLPPVNLAVNTDVDEAELSAEVTQAANNIAANVEVDTSVDSAELASEVGAAADASTPTVEVSTSVDSGELAAEVGAAADAANPNIEVSTSVDSAELATEATGAADAVTPTITYRAQIDSAGLTSAASSAGAAIGAALGGSGAAGGAALGNAVRESLSKGGKEGSESITQSLQSSAQKIGTSLFSFGGGISAVLGLKAGISDLEIIDKKVRETATLFGQPASQSGGLIDSLRSGVQEVSNELGILQTDIVPALYDSISAGVPQSGINQFLVDVGKFATAGASDMTVAGDAVTTALNAWQLDASKTTEVTDSLFAAVQGGKTTVDQLGGALFNVAPAAASLNVPLQEVNAALAAMTSQGIPTSVATTRLNAAFTALLSSSKELTPVFQGLGYESAEVAIRQEGLQFALDSVYDAAGGTATGLLNLLGPTEAVQAAQVLAGTGAEKFSSELERQANAAGTVSEAFKIMDEGPAATIRRFKTDLQTLGVALAEAFSPILSAGLPALQAFVPIVDAAVPIIGALAKGVEIAANAFGALPGPLQTAVIAGVAWNKAGDGIIGKVNLLTKSIQGFGGIGNLLSSAFTSSAGSATSAGGAFTKVVGGIAALGPAGIAAGAAIGVIGAAYLSAKKKSDDFKKATAEVTKALQDQDGVLNTSTAALADYLGTQSRFVDRNQVDDLGRMKTSWTEVAQQIEAGEDGLREFIAAAIDAGEIDVAQGLKTDDAIDQYLKGQDQVLTGNTDIIKSFEEVRDSREKAFDNNINALLVDGRISKDGQALAQNYKEMGLSAEQALDKLEQMEAIVPKIVGSLEGTTLNFGELSQEAQDFASEMDRAGASSGEILQGLSDKSLLTATDLQALQPQLERAGTGIVELGLASSTAENDMAAMSERSAAAAEANRALAEATGTAVTQLNELNTLDLGDLKLVLPDDISAEALEDVADVLTEMREFADENNIPVELVARFGQDALEGMKDQFETITSGVEGIFEIDIDPDITSLSEALDSAERQIIADQNFSQNLRQMYEDGFTGVAQFIATLGDDQAAAFVEEFMGSSDDVKREMEKKSEVFKTTFREETQEWGKLGADSAGIFAPMLSAEGEALNSFLQNELAKTPDIVASELSELGVVIQGTTQTGMAGVVNTILGASGAISGATQTSMGGVVNTILSASGAISGATQTSMGGVVNTILSASGAFPGATQTGMNGVVNTILGASGAISGATQTSMNGVVNTILGASGAISGAASQTGTALTTAYGTPVITGLPTTTQTAFNSTANTILGASGPMGSAAAQTGAAVPQGFGTGLPGMDPLTRAAFESVNGVIRASQGILGVAAGVAGQEIGRRFGDGIEYGINSKQGTVQAAANRLANVAANAMRAALAIASPSKVGVEIGDNFGGSVGMGVAGAEGAVADASADLAKAAVDGANFDGIDESAAKAAAGISDSFSDVTLIPESEQQKTLNFLDIASEKVRGITLEDIQSPTQGNVFTSFADKAFDQIINGSVNEMFTRAATQAVGNLGPGAAGNYQAGAGSTVASQGLSPAAYAEIGRLIAAGQTTTNVNVSAPATPIIDPYNPRSATRTADIVGNRISEVLERSNRGEN